MKWRRDGNILGHNMWTVLSKDAGWFWAWYHSMRGFTLSGTNLRSNVHYGCYSNDHPSRATPSNIIRLFSRVMVLCINRRKIRKRVRKMVRKTYGKLIGKMYNFVSRLKKETWRNRQHITALGVPQSRITVLDVNERSSAQVRKLTGDRLPWNVEVEPKVFAHVLGLVSNLGVNPDFGGEYFKYLVIVQVDLWFAVFSDLLRRWDSDSRSTREEPVLIGPNKWQASWMRKWCQN